MGSTEPMDFQRGVPEPMDFSKFYLQLDLKLVWLYLYFFHDTLENCFGPHELEILTQPLERGDRIIQRNTIVKPYGLEKI